MNLIAKEYIASRTDRTGVLILSEMAGAAKELGEALIVNPNDVEELADALREALTMPREEQIKRNEIMQQRLKRYDVVRWASDFVQSLHAVKEQQTKMEARVLSLPLRKQLQNDYANAQRRLLLFDYDGTLVPFASEPRFAAPKDEVVDLLRSFAQQPATDTVLISGRDKDSLDTWFGDLGIGLIAEHGVWIKERNGDWKLTKPVANEWKAQIRSVFEVYADRLPRSFIEEKEYSLAFHYRLADPDLASLRVKELTDNLVHLSANMDVQVLKGSKVVEMRNAGIHKGSAALQFLSRSAYDFILAIGDDWTDEDLFRSLPETAYSIKVGIAPSHAKFNLRNHQEVVSFLQELWKE
jgi:trehalose 6-phosphate synthase/phosphatase